MHTFAILDADTLPIERVSVTLCSTDRPVEQWAMDRHGNVSCRETTRRDFVKASKHYDEQGRVTYTQLA